MTQTLSKQAFYDELAQHLARGGWTRLPGPHELSALFGKRAGDLLLTLGIDESQLHRHRVTAEIALAGHTSLTMSFPDAPRARQRVGTFLRAEERTELLQPEFCKPGVSDAWWIGRTVDNAARIAAASRVAEPRFLAQSGLLEEISKSSRHTAYVSKLRQVAGTHFDESTTARPPPQEWIDAAYEIFSDAHPKHRRAFAAKVAADAWRTFHILPPDSADGQ